MRKLLILMGAVVVLASLASCGFVLDLVLNDGQILYALAGRARLEGDCRPLTVERLIGKGFSPVDLTFAPRPSLSFASGSNGVTRTLLTDFTFSDGPDGQRVDGSLVCTVSGHTIDVDVDVRSLPIRAT